MSELIAKSSGEIRAREALLGYWWYEKSEADKVIAEKDDEIAELKVKLKVQTSNAEKAWKLKDSYHTNYAEAVKELYDKNKEIAELKAAAKEPAVPNRTCRKCGRATLMYMPLVRNGRIYWDLFNNKGIDHVFGIQCAHCGEVAFVTKQMHEDKIRHQKYKRCLGLAEWCKATALFCYQAANTLPAGFHATLYGKPVMIEPKRLFKRHVLLTKWSARWSELAEKFKEAKCKL